ncbi:hypothetical protein [Burkholderia sp. COPS]|uniref:hypothetical protein n=1 Tax=Burkholderia sp. COPS TaxID=2597663 RepID=UPI0021556CA8|nr:hypothetical protein [Burkholderia sp. COPS]
MRTLIAALVRRGPTVLAGGVGLGLLVPPLADLARPLMPVTVFLFVLGTLLRVEPSAVRAVARRPAVSLLLPAATMIACPVALGIAARLAGMPYDWVVALVIAYCAPPSSGTSTIARMLSLDASVALVATLASMVFVPLTAPLLTAWFSHDAAVSISPLNLALRLALLIGSAEGVALLVRRFAGSRLDRYATPIDATVVAALLVFALGTMAGRQRGLPDHRVRAHARRRPHTAQCRADRRQSQRRSDVGRARARRDAHHGARVHVRTVADLHAPARRPASAAAPRGTAPAPACTLAGARRPPSSPIKDPA